MKHDFELAEWGETFMAAYSGGGCAGPRCTRCSTSFCVHCQPERMDEDCPAATAEGPRIEVKKIAAYFPMSNELAMEYGLIPDTRPPVVIPWRRRVRWAAQARVRRARLRVGSWVAGEDLDPDRYDYD